MSIPYTGVLGLPGTEEYKLTAEHDAYEHASVMWMEDDHKLHPASPDLVMRWMRHNNIYRSRLGSPEYWYMVSGDGYSTNADERLDQWFIPVTR